MVLSWIPSPNPTFSRSSSLRGTSGNYSTGSSRSIFSSSVSILAIFFPSGVSWYSTFGGTSLKTSREIIEKRKSLRSLSLRTLAVRPGIFRVSAPGRLVPLAICRRTTTVHLQPKTSSMTRETLKSIFFDLFFFVNEVIKVYQKVTSALPGAYLQKFYRSLMCLSYVDYDY